MLTSSLLFLVLPLYLFKTNILVIIKVFSFRMTFPPLPNPLFVRQLANARTFKILMPPRVGIPRRTQKDSPPSPTRP